MTRLRGLAGRALASGRKRLEPLALGGLRWAAFDRTVAVLEYLTHPAARYGWGNPPNPAVAAALTAREGEAEDAAARVSELTEDVRAIPGGRPGPGVLSWDNDWWGGLDAVMLYTALRDRRPANYVEVGSGWSTRFADRARRDHGLPTRITSIDPQPRAEIDALCDMVVRSPLESADLSLFDDLSAGDVVLVDCSHTAFMNSDSVVALLDVMPRLPEGVLLGIDDVFLPWDYPPTWAGRWYGEQYLLAAWLLGGGQGWSIRFPAFHLTQVSESRRRFDAAWEHLAPLNGRYAMSFWLERTGDGTPKRSSG